MLALVWSSRKVFTKDKVYVLPVRRMLKYNKLSTRRWELSCQFQMIPCYRQTSPGLEKLDNIENKVRHSRRIKAKELVHLSCSVLALSLSPNAINSREGQNWTCAPVSLMSRNWILPRSRRDDWNLMPKCSKKYHSRTPFQWEVFFGATRQLDERQKDLDEHAVTRPPALEIDDNSRGEKVKRISQ